MKTIPLVQSCEECKTPLRGTVGFGNKLTGVWYACDCRLNPNKEGEK